MITTRAKTPRSVIPRRIRQLATRGVLKTRPLKRIIVLLVVFVSLSGCNRLASIPYDPLLTPQDWLQIQPFLEVKLGGSQFILMQPSSSLLVYLLGLIGIGLGLPLILDPKGQTARRWWGIALLLWGAGALAAGTSYQAFSYEIKCVGQSVCSWTSWWEIAYLILSAASVDAMLISGAHSSCLGSFRTALQVYAALDWVIYTLVVLIGAFTLQEFLISFELLLLTAGSNILLLFVISLSRTLQYQDMLDRRLLITWVWLGGVIGVYYLYLLSGVENILWERGLWFSANDILHIGLISWMAHIALGLSGDLRDLSDSTLGQA